MTSDILSYIASFVNLTYLTAYALIVALVFNILTLRHNERIRREQATLEHLRDFQSESFAKMDALFRKLPNNLLPNELVKLDLDLQVALQFIGRHLESLGIAVSLGVLDIKVVERTLGNNVVLYWEKIKPFAAEMRKDPRSSDFAKWTEWLSDTLASRQKRLNSCTT